MKPTLTIGNAVVYHGNNLEVLPTLPDNSVDSIVCDPPYELGFMGKKWDSSGIAYSVELWTECMRVLKPGGHLLAFSGSRTYHRMVVAIEDAGFEIRDMIAWVSNKTFPKSMDISKAIDKRAGANREVIGTWTPTGTARLVGGKNPDGIWTNPDNAELKGELPITAPATDEAKQWAGWGTALKPTVEPIVMARKPLIGTVAENVLTWGVGGLNIDGSRIKANGDNLNGGKRGGTNNEIYSKGLGDTSGQSMALDGRWPANIILDEQAAIEIDEQSGDQVRGNAGSKQITDFRFMGESTGKQKLIQGVTDKGGASRFFYVARASKSDRGEGNTHPTVKPTQLMQYLIRLVTPPNGTVLDPFTGSGSTGKAALLNGFKFIGIELSEEYLPIIEGRLTHASQAKEEEESETLF